MKKIIALVAVFFLISSHIQSQSLFQVVKGNVLDKQSKFPVIGATVIIKGSDPILGSSVDEDGNFRIEAVPVGRQTLIFSSIGYEQKVMSNITVTSGKQVFLNIELVESLRQLEEVIVVANEQDRGKPINELATVSTISLSVEQTNRYAATFDDPARAALSQAGVTAGDDDLLNEIVIRGNSPKGLLWRLEGVEIPNPNHFGRVGSSAGGISMLSGSMLANSDFFTGAFPAQYGNATSGIFDMKMRKGNFEKREYAFQAGLLGVAASMEGPLSKSSNASYLVNYRYSTLGLLSNLGLDILGDQEGVTFQDLAFKVHLPTKKLGSFSVWGLGGRNTYEYKPDPLLGDSYFEDDIQKMGVGGLTHITYFGQNTYLESIASVSFQKSTYIWDSLKIRVEELEEFTETNFRLSSFLNHKFNAKNMLRIGGIYSRLNFDLHDEVWIRSEERYEINLDVKGGNDFYQGFAQWQHRLNEDFTVNTGFHISHFALNQQTYFEPRLGFRWQASSKSAFTGGFGMHSRRETMALYLGQEELENGEFVKNNQNLGFTKATHLVLGYENMLKPDLRFKTEVYYQDLYDVPVWGNDTTTSSFARTFSTINRYSGYTTVPLANNGDGRNYGIEMTMEKFFNKNYYFMVTGSLYESKYTPIDGIERNTTFNGNYVFNLLGGKDFQLSNKYNSLSVNARFIYAGGKREAPILLNQSISEGYTVRDFNRNYEFKLADYTRVDIGISYKRNKKKYASVFALNIQNVAGIENTLGRYYNPFIGEIVAEKQLSFFPNLSYRVEF